MFLTDPGNRVFVSTISLWEISLKYSIGKLNLENITPEELPPFILDSGFEFMEASPETYASFHKLPKTGHADPFDRMIVWPASRYPLPFLPK